MPDELWNHLIQIGIGGIMLWVVKTVQDMTVEMKAFRVTLFGDTGDNGINGSTKKLRDDVDENRQRIGELRTDVEVVKDRLGLHGAM